MIDFDFDTYCSGCGACMNTCPVGAIVMKENTEGFLIPKIDLEICVKCGKCDSVCPHLNRSSVTNDTTNVQGVWLYASKNDQAKMKSSSGAACYELCKSMLNEGGYICGCAWDNNLKAVHILGNTEQILVSTQGSKYVQSDTGTSYQKILELLSAGNKVAFTGTPCQATGIHHVVQNYKGGIYRKNLLNIAVICHGVASPKAWESYKAWTEKETGSPLVSVNFRDKSKEGYKKSYCCYKYANGNTVYLPTYLPSSKYIEATLVYNLAIRNSCTHCDCKGVNSGIDLVVGDWYAAYRAEGRLGTSCIVAFTERGRDYVKSNLDRLKDFSYEDVLRDNSFIQDSIKKSPNREAFFKEIDNVGCWDNIEKLYPSKYKKFLIKVGLYSLVKKIIK